MNLDEAFTDAPPILSNGLFLRPFDSKISHLIGQALDRIEDKRDLVGVGAYVVAASLPALEAVKTLRLENAVEYFEAAVLGLAPGEYESVSE